jgi:katanin p80 WD40 repeat-containing subunit B1
VYRKNINIS